MRLRCEVCGGSDFVRADGSYRCEGCGMRYGIEELRLLVAEGRDEPEGAGGQGEPSFAADGRQPGPVDGRWQTGRRAEGGEDHSWDDAEAGAWGHGAGVSAGWAERAVPRDGRVATGRRVPLDALSTRALLLIGVAVFGACFLVSRTSFDLRVIGMSVQEWLLFSYTALLLATLERRDSRLMRVVTISCSILTIVAFCLQVQAWERDGTFCLLRLPGSSAPGVAREATGTTGAASPGELGTFEVRTVSGRGDGVVPIDCRPTPCLVDVTYSGEGDFTLATCGEDGDRRSLLVEARGPYGGRVTTYGDEGDAATLEVSAEGAWELTFSPMDAVARVEFDGDGTSETFHGDSVVYVDEESMDGLRFTHRGEGDFTVRAVTAEGGEVLVDATGAFDDTVAWDEPRAFLVVGTDGDWSMGRS